MNRFAHACSAVAVVLAAAVTASASPEPGITIYHVAYDDAEIITYGTYTGLSNPNYGRLVFLLSHTFESTPTSNHFHRIGSYGYTGDYDSPTVALSTNNSVPEPYQGDDGLTLLPGAGLFSGKVISGLGPAAIPGDEIEQEYGDITIAPIDELYQYDGQADPDGEFDYHPGHYLLNSSFGAYAGTMDDVTVGMKLVGLTPGLTVHETDGSVVFDAIDEMVTLGPGDDWSFDPVFAVDAGGPAGETYEATFVLTDLSDTPLYGDSAEFTFIFTTVPEPGAAALGLMAFAGLLVRRRQA